MKYKWPVYGGIGKNITEHKQKCDFICIQTSTPPAIVANPPVITACNSDLVISAKNGLINNGAKRLIKMEM